MLKKAFRLNTGAFKHVFTHGQEKKYSNFLVKWLDERESARFGVAVSKKLKLNAVARNKHRRMVYDGIQECEKISNLDKWVVFILLRNITPDNNTRIKKEINEILTFLNNEVASNETN